MQQQQKMWEKKERNKENWSRTHVGTNILYDLTKHSEWNQKLFTIIIIIKFMNMYCIFIKCCLANWMKRESAREKQSNLNY